MKEKHIFVRDIGIFDNLEEFEKWKTDNKELYEKHTKFKTLNSCDQGFRTFDKMVAIRLYKLFFWQNFVHKNKNMPLEEAFELAKKEIDFDDVLEELREKVNNPTNILPVIHLEYPGIKTKEDMNIQLDKFDENFK